MKSCEHANDEDDETNYFKTLLETILIFWMFIVHFRFYIIRCIKFVVQIFALEHQLQKAIVIDDHEFENLKPKDQIYFNNTISI